MRLMSASVISLSCNPTIVVKLFPVGSRVRLTMVGYVFCQSKLAIQSSLHDVPVLLVVSRPDKVFDKLVVGHSCFCVTAQLAAGQSVPKRIPESVVNTVYPIVGKDHVCPLRTLNRRRPDAAVKANTADHRV